MVKRRSGRILQLNHAPSDKREEGNLVSKRRGLWKAIGYGPQFWTVQMVEKNKKSGLLAHSQRGVRWGKGLSSGKDIHSL